MTNSSPLYTLNGIVEAPDPEVAKLLLTVHEGPIDKDNAFTLYQPDGPKLALRGGPDTFTGGIADDPNGLHVEVDRARRMVAVQGQWWFRGECRVEPHPRGARLVQQVLNVAQTKRWMVPLIWLQTGAHHKAGARKLLERVGERLGCRAYVE